MSSLIQNARGLLYVGACVETNGDGSKTGRAVRGTVLCVHDNHFFIDGNEGTFCDEHGRYEGQSFKIKFSSPGWINVQRTVSIGFTPTPSYFNQVRTTSVRFNVDPLNSKPMNKLIQFVKNLTLSEDDKLLIAQGIEDPTNEPTCAGLELSARISYKANRTAIIEHARALKVEQDKEKK